MNDITIANNKKSPEINKPNQFLTVLVSCTLMIIVFALAFLIAYQSIKR